MFTIHPIFCRNQQIKYDIKNNSKNNTNICKSFDSNVNLNKVSAENYKANYVVNFKGGMRYEQSDSSGIGTLNHQTAFFREPKTDEIVQDYIIENFGDEDEINIVSGACSTGEEAKSYAMMLDSLGNKLKIMGFDISSEILKEAQNNTCQLTKQDNSNSSASYLQLNSESILLTDNIDDLTEYERKCRDKFQQYYQSKGLPCKAPVFPEAIQKLKDLETLLANKEEYEKQKKLYNEHMQAAISMAPGLAEFMSSITFEDSINMSKSALEQQTEIYKTVADFEAEEHAFNNCTFEMGDVTNLEHMYKPGSINVLLYRNALYHTLCQGNNMLRFMKDDAAEIMDSIAKQMNKVLKINGLVVFGETENLQGINTKTIEAIMKDNGFILLQEDAQNTCNNIWIKCENL